MAADAVKNQEQEEYDRNHGGEERSGESEEDSQYDDEEDEDELRRDPDGDMYDDDYDGNQTTKESGSPDLGENLSRAKLTQGEYVKRAQTAKP